LETFFFKVWEEYSLAGFGNAIQIPAELLLTKRGRLIHAMANTADNLGLKHRLGLAEFWGNDFVGLNFEFDWNHPVSNLFADPTLQASTTRPVLKTPSLHIQVTFGTGMFVDPMNATSPSNINDPTEVTWGLSGMKGPIAFQAEPVAAFPMQWIVPGTDAKGKKAGFQIPSPKKVSFDVQSVGANNSFELIELIPIANGFNDFRDEQDFSLPKTMGIGHLAAATSSVGAKPINPNVFSQILFNATEGNISTFERFLNTTFSDEVLGQPTQAPTPYREYLDGTKSMGMANMAVCTKLLDDKTCPYPHSRFLDGGFSDDMATAITIADLQQRYKGKPLRVILTDQGSVKEGIPDLHDLAPSFFFDGSSPTPGEFAVDPIRGFIRASPATFRLPVTKLEDLNFNSSSLPNVTRPGLPGIGIDCNEICTKHKPRQLFWTKITTETVNNPSFDVKAGTRVEILIFFVESEENLVFSAPASNGHHCHACLAQTVSISPIIKELVADFLK